MERKIKEQAELVGPVMDRARKPRLPRVARALAVCVRICKRENANSKALGGLGDARG